MRSQTVSHSVQDNISSVISVITNYQDLITNLEKGTDSLNSAVENMLSQIDAVVSGKLVSGIEDIEIKTDDLEGMTASQLSPVPGRISLKSKSISNGAQQKTTAVDADDIVSHLRSDITALQNEAKLLQESAQGIAGRIADIMGHVSEGNIEAATKTAEKHLGELDDLDEAITNTTLLNYPAPFDDQIQGKSLTDTLTDEKYQEAFNSDSSSNSNSDFGSDHDTSSDEKNGSETDPVTIGNYKNPFPTTPPVREYSTIAFSSPPSSIMSRFTSNFYAPYNRSSINQIYLRQRGFSNDSNSKKKDDILVMAAETYAIPVADEESTDSLAAYADKKRGSKRRSLDGRAKRRAVPDTKMKRALGFGALAASVGWGTISEMAKRTMEDPTGENRKSPLLSDENVERIVSKLCQMRGAALKIGQMISIQDEGLISPEFAKIMARVRENADFMPEKQFEAQMQTNLGNDWQGKYKDFDMIPFAAASLGQVHYATLHDGTKVVVKVQYPGVADSINSDIDNLTAVLSVVNLVPKGAHVDQALAIAKKELAYETDYIREANSQEKMRKLIGSDPDFEVPRVFKELSSKHVLTQEFVEGDPIDDFVDAPMELRNAIGLKMLKLCLRELFEFQYMQTDPNWSNFFYDTKKKKIMLLDFGATLDLSEEFSNNYLQVIRACATSDRQAIIDASIKMEFLSGYESEVMLDAHCEAIRVVGEPFSSDEPYNFVEKAAYKRVAKLLEVFAKHRITPPPEESYALNRKLSGAFLLCNKLNVVIPCKPLFDKIYDHKSKTIN